MLITDATVRGFSHCCCFWHRTAGQAGAMQCPWALGDFLLIPVGEVWGSGVRHKPLSLTCPRGSSFLPLCKYLLFQMKDGKGSHGRGNSEIIKDNIASKSVSVFSNSISYSNKRCYLSLQTLTGLYPFITTSTILLLQ